ncbi:MAG: tRNA pseudouridine(55) synthase TruB [Gammaproteobacteria bacterium]|nr:tRNA pseudouridine(55) synthase TruB [Gammaproteobacteria bacterium]
MPRRRRGRDLDAILLLDKPLGMSSNRALQRAKALFGAAKAGHTGSLDPLATGMLPVCFGQATKLCGLLLEASKAYTFEAQLGVATETGDAEGAVIGEAPVPDIGSARLAAVLADFRGPIRQVPPMYSALKHQGRRLYALARAGESVERAPREVTIHALEAAGSPDTAGRLRLFVRCSKGTYVRTLAEDVARALGTLAHLTMLRRDWVEPFEGLPMYTLERLEAMDASAREACLQPLARGLRHLPAVSVDDDAAASLLDGRVVIDPRPPAAREQPGRLCAYGPHDVLLGLVEPTDDGRLAPRRMFRGVSELRVTDGPDRA